MLLQVFVLTCLSVTLLADTSVHLECQKCSGGSCYVGTGGGFTGKLVRNSQFPSCNELSVTFTFRCSQQCGQGCMISSNKEDGTTCTSSAQGKFLVESLNLLYSFDNNDEKGTLTYPWCQCGTSGVVWVVLFLALMGVGAISFCWLYWKKRKPKEIPRSQFSAAISNYQMA